MEGGMGGAGKSDTDFLSTKAQRYEKEGEGAERSEDKSVLEAVRNVCTRNADKSMLFLAVGKSLLKHKKYPKVKIKMGLLESDDVFLIYNASLFGMEGPCIVLCSSGVYMKDADGLRRLCGSSFVFCIPYLTISEKKGQFHFTFSSNMPIEILTQDN